MFSKDILGPEKLEISIAEINSIQTVNFVACFLIIRKINKFH